MINAHSAAKHRTLVEQINADTYADGGPIGKYANSGIGKYKDGGVVGDLGQSFAASKAIAIQAGSDLAWAAAKKRIEEMKASYSGGGTWVPGEVAGSRGKFLDAIASKMGSAYSWGADGPTVFDCSGLMSWGLRQAGIGFTGG